MENVLRLYIDSGYFIAGVVFVLLKYTVEELWFDSDTIIQQHNKHNIKTESIKFKSNPPNAEFNEKSLTSIEKDIKLEVNIKASRKSVSNVLHCRICSTPKKGKQPKPQSGRVHKDIFNFIDQKNLFYYPGYGLKRIRPTVRRKLHF